MCNSVIDTFDYIVKYIPKHTNAIPKHKNSNQTQSQQGTQNAKYSNGAHEQAAGMILWNDTLKSARNGHCNANGLECRFR